MHQVDCMGQCQVMTWQSCSLVGTNYWALDLQCFDASSGMQPAAEDLKASPLLTLSDNADSSSRSALTITGVPPGVSTQFKQCKCGNAQFRIS